MDEPWKHYAKQSKPDTKNNSCMIPLIWGIWDSQILRDTKLSGGCQGLGEIGKASKYLMIQNFSLGKQNCAGDGWWC